VKKLLFVANIILLLTIFTGCADEGPDIDFESAIPVKVEAVELKSIREYVIATGTVQASQEAVFKSEQAGYYKLQHNSVTGKSYAMGDRVISGQVIIVLNNPEYENQVMIESKKLNYEISKREFDKQKNLYEKGGVTLRELTDAERTFIDSRYSYNNAQIQLAKLRTTSPFDGILVELDYYSPNQLVEPGQPLATVMDYSKLYCEIKLPGKEMANISTDQKALIFNYTHPLDTLKGVIQQVSPALDPESRMFTASLLIDNDSLLLRPGMFVKVMIITAEKEETVVIPREIVQERQQGKVVFVVEKGIAVQRSIETGLSNRDEFEIISGVEAEERIVVDGFETLRQRSRVRVIK